MASPFAFVRTRNPDLTNLQPRRFADRYVEDLGSFTPSPDPPRDSDVNDRFSTMPVTLFGSWYPWQDDINEPLNKVAFPSPNADEPRGLFSPEVMRVNVHKPLSRPFGSYYELR